MGKLEKKVKEQLERRKITPSAGSWQKLSSQLEAQDKKKTNYKWILGVAASFMAGILIASLFGNDNTTEVHTVNTPQNNFTQLKTEEKENIFSEELEGELVYDTKKIKEIVGELPEDETVLKNTELVKEVKNDSFTSKKILTANAKNKSSHNRLLKKQPYQEAIATHQDVEKINIFKEIDNEAQKVVDNVKLLSENHEVTEAEIDELIRQAQLKIRTHNIFEDHRNKINAQALLENVEAELDHSFRERIFIAIEKGFTQVKSAVTFLGK